jgi:hypothetical protein
MQLTSTVRVTVAIVVVVAAIGAGVGVGPVAGQQPEPGSSVLDDVFGTDESDNSSGGLFGVVASESEFLPAYVSGVTERVAASAPGRERTAEECATDLQAEVNEHSAAYTRYINDRVLPEKKYDVIEVRCTHSASMFASGGSETIYLTATVAIQNQSIVYRNLTAVDSTSRAVDHTIVLSGVATEQMPDDLAEYRETYVAENETPDDGYVRRIGAKYKGHVAGTPSFLADPEEP